MIKPVEADIYIYKNSFSSQWVPQTAKLCLSVVLKHFEEYSQRTSLFSQKSDYLWKENWNTQAVCFSYDVWKGENPEENLDLFKQLLFIKPLKGENINKNCFSPQSEPHTAKLCLSVVLKYIWGNS